MDAGHRTSSILDAGRTCGRILSVSGSQASVGLPLESIDPVREASITVGKFLRIQRAKSLLVGMVTEVTQDITAAAREQGFRAAARLDMMGEIKQRDDGKAYFQRGVTDYPAIGDPAALITRDELRLIYDISSGDTIDIGHLQQDTSIGPQDSVRIQPDLLPEAFKYSRAAFIRKEITGVLPQNQLERPLGRRPLRIAIMALQPAD